MPPWRFFRNIPDDRGADRPKDGQPSAAQPDSNADALSGDPVIRELRTLYQGVAAEPLPEALLQLLEELDKVERKR